MSAITEESVDRALLLHASTTICEKADRPSVSSTDDVMGVSPKGGTSVTRYAPRIIAEYLLAIVYGIIYHDDRVVVTPQSGTPYAMTITVSREP
jgi:hypothetical protein